MKRKPQPPGPDPSPERTEKIFRSFAHLPPEVAEAMSATAASGISPTVEAIPVEELGPPPNGVPWDLLPRILGLPVALIVDLEKRILGSAALTLRPRGKNQAHHHLLGSDADWSKPDLALVHTLALHGAAYLWSQPEGVAIRLQGPPETADTIQSDSSDFTELAQVMKDLGAPWSLGFEVEFQEIWRTKSGNYAVTARRASEVTHRMFMAAKGVMRGFIYAYIDLHGLPKKEGRALERVFHNAFRTLDRKISQIDFEPRSDRLLRLLNGVLREQRRWLVQEDRWLVLGGLMEAFEAIPPDKKSKNADALRERIKAMLARAARRAPDSK